MSGSSRGSSCGVRNVSTNEVASFRLHDKVSIDEISVYVYQARLSGA